MKVLKKNQHCKPTLLNEKLCLTNGNQGNISWLSAWANIRRFGSVRGPSARDQSYYYTIKKIKKSKKPGQKNAHSFSWSEAALELRYDKPRMERNISTSKDSLINCDKSEVWVNLCPIGEAIQAISKLLLLNQPAARALCFDSHSWLIKCLFMCNKPYSFC